MLRDNAEVYYLEQDYNCAETTLRLINDRYDLGLKDDDFKLVGAYGGGFGCGITCGVLASDMAAIGRLAIEGRAHATEGFKELCARYVSEFQEKMGSADCCVVKEKFVDGDRRCIKVVQDGADLFERFVTENKLI